MSSVSDVPQPAGPSAEDPHPSYSKPRIPNPFAEEQSKGGSRNHLREVTVAAFVPIGVIDTLLGSDEYSADKLHPPRPTSHWNAIRDDVLVARKTEKSINAWRDFVRRLAIGTLQ